MASFILNQLPNGIPFQHVKSSCSCSLIPDYLLEDISESDQVPEHARACARLTLELNRQFRSHRLGRTQRQSAVGGYPTIPGFMHQEIIDSPDSTDEDKQRAQKALQSMAQESTQAGLAPGEPIPPVQRVIYNANNKSQLPGQPIRKEGAPATKDVNADQVYEYFGDTFKTFAEVFFRNSIDDKGEVLEGTVHYDDERPPPGFNNAFWNGQRMVFGDGDNIMFKSFTAAVDVIAHELTHGVTENTANLPYWSQSGALNESMSDVFGSIVKQYAKKQTSDQADWLIGEGIFAPDFQGRALRDMKAPGTAYNDPRLKRKDQQVGDMKSYKDLPLTQAGDNGGVHINSGIPNRAFYLVAKALGGHSWDVAGKIWYKTLLDPRLKDFAQSPANWPNVFGYFAALTLDNAKPSGQKAVKAITDAWKTVGVVVAKL